MEMVPVIPMDRWILDGLLMYSSSFSFTCSSPHLISSISGKLNGSTS